MRLQKVCLYCKKELVGRTDKKYCNLHCKSAYQYQKIREQPERFYNKVDNQLRLNRRLLKQFNKAGKSVVRCETLLKLGFNPKFVTHYWKNKKGGGLPFCIRVRFFEKEREHKGQVNLDYLARLYSLTTLNA